MSGTKSPAYLSVTAALMTSGGRLFVARRPPWKKFGLLWEFPGGKVEPGEDLRGSLAREIKEELCLDVTVRDLFRTVSHREEDFAIHLHAYWCSVRGGKLCLREHVAFRWANLSELGNIDLTGADRLLIPFLEKLPELPVYPGDVFPGMANEA
ncbi:MAG: (deoxy)nucleoside triphosphate pyrophosphohydrolase [Syntrophobacteraceae bacterium]